MSQPKENNAATRPNNITDETEIKKKPTKKRSADKNIKKVLRFEDQYMTGWVCIFLLNHFYKQIVSVGRNSLVLQPAPV